MNDQFYILDGHRPVPVKDVPEWGKWFQTADRHVGETQIGKIRVSTVFLGLDHSFGQGPPLLFETMIFPDQDYQTRCTTWEQAEKMHKKAVRLVRETQGK